MGSGKGGEETTTQTNAPPAWAAPALERAGRDLLDMYQRGEGYNTYTGPTQAGMSGPTMQGMNAMMAATGGQGQPITNETVSRMVPETPAQPKPRQPQRQQERQPLWGSHPFVQPPGTRAGGGR